MVQCLFKTLPDEPGIHEKKNCLKKFSVAKLRIECESRCAGPMFCFLLCITETYFETRLHHQKYTFEARLHHQNTIHRVMVLN